MCKQGLCSTEFYFTTFCCQVGQIAFQKNFPNLSSICLECKQYTVQHYHEGELYRMNDYGVVVGFALECKYFLWKEGA